MKPLPALPLSLAVALSCLPGWALAETVQIDLRGHEEVPAVSSTAHGSFRAVINAAGGQIAYELSYANLQGEVRQAHIHVGQRSANGGVSVFLCQTTFNPDPSGLAPMCPESGTVTGVLNAANVLGPGGQGVAAGEFAELVDAIRNGVTYVNVHSTTFPGGEIRGQLNAGRNMSGH